MGGFAGVFVGAILKFVISNTEDLIEEQSTLFLPLPEKTNKSHLAIKGNSRRNDLSISSV